MNPLEAFQDSGLSAGREWVHGVWEECGIEGNDKSPGGSVTGECAEEQREQGRKVCEGHTAKSLAYQESGFHTIG